MGQVIQQKPNQFKILMINVFPATSTIFHSKSVTLHPYFFKILD